MGNVHAFAHRVIAISMACLASAGLILCALSGFNCSFLSINAQPGRHVMTPWGQEFVNQELAFIGVKCESPFYEEMDRMWNLSQLFFWISLACGCLTTAMAWALSLFVAPNNCNWRCLSMMAAVTAVMGVPVFLIFESEPCNMDIYRQTCSLALGSYFNIASVVLWVVLTLWTQCLDPPNWSSERGAWMTSKMNINEITIPENGTDGSTSGPKDFNGEIFVTSNGDGLGIWAMGSGHRGKKIVNDDAVSAVSSISDGEKEKKKDIEAPAEIKHRTVPPTTMEDTDDQDIRKGAAIVIDALREKTKSLRQTVQSYQLPRFEISSTGATSKNTGRESDRDRIRGRALIDSDYSAHTNDQPGVELALPAQMVRKRKQSFRTRPLVSLETT
jgi:hypothetical protein